MNQTLAPILYTIGSVAMAYAAVVGVASVVMHSLTRWWTSQVGRHLMSYRATVTVILLLGVVKFVFGDSWWFQVIRTVVFLGIPVLMTQWLVLQIRARREALAADRQRDAL